MPQRDILIEWLAFLLTLLAWSIFSFVQSRNSRAAPAEAGETLRKWTGRYMPWIVVGELFFIGFFALPIVFDLRRGIRPDLPALLMLMNLSFACLQFFP